MRLLSRRFDVRYSVYSRNMDSWDFAFGVVAGFVIAVGGFLAVGAAIMAMFRWATEFATPQNPSLEDEDEIDHRFY
jgi:hypothetical protein